MYAFSLWTLDRFIIYLRMRYYCGISDNAVRLYCKLRNKYFGYHDEVLTLLDDNRNSMWPAMWFRVYVHVPGINYSGLVRALHVPDALLMCFQNGRDPYSFTIFCFQHRNAIQILPL